MGKVKEFKNDLDPVVEIDEVVSNIDFQTDFDTFFNEGVKINTQDYVAKAIEPFIKGDADIDSLEADASEAFNTWLINLKDRQVKIGEQTGTIIYANRGSDNILVQSEDGWAKFYCQADVKLI